MSPAAIVGLLSAFASTPQAVDNQASDAFAVEAEGLRHIALGYACPRDLPDAVLVGSRPGAPGKPTAPGVYCEYQEAGTPVAYVAFTPTAGPGLTDAGCQELPGLLRLETGPPLPGVRQYDEVGPWPEALPAPTVSDEPVDVLTCTLGRAPRTVVYASAAFSREGWTVRSIATPIPPPCCGGYAGVRLVAKDLLALVLIILTTQAFTPPSV